jgi:hypothetical protein
MLYFSFTRIFKAKGIDKPFSYLVNHGFSGNFATAVVSNRYRRLALDDVERLCELFLCTPNDLMQWIPSKKDVDIVSHPLASLYRVEKVMDLTRTLNEVPLDKLLEIEKIIKAEIDK